MLIKVRATLLYMQVQVKVLAIYIDEDKVRSAGPGENLRVRVSGIEEEDILSGFVLSSVGMFSLFCFPLMTNFCTNREDTTIPHLVF